MVHALIHETAPHFLDVVRTMELPITIINAFESVDRRMFVHPDFMKHAYDDSALPIDGNQTISQPSVMALMMKELKLAKTHKILEIGTGCGYQAAILAQLCARVYTIERIRTLLYQAEQRFKSLKLRNIVTLYADGHHGWAAAAPFDRIIISASCPTIPEKLCANLAEGGVMMVPLGSHIGHQRLVRLTKIDGVMQTEDLSAVKFVPMRFGIK